MMYVDDLNANTEWCGDVNTRHALSHVYGNAQTQFIITMMVVLSFNSMSLYYYIMLCIGVLCMSTTLCILTQ